MDKIGGWIGHIQRENIELRCEVEYLNNDNADLKVFIAHISQRVKKNSFLDRLKAVFLGYEFDEAEFYALAGFHDIKFTSTGIKIESN